LTNHCIDLDQLLHFGLNITTQQIAVTQAARVILQGDGHLLPTMASGAGETGMIAGTGSVTFAVGVVFADRQLSLLATLGVLFFAGFAMRERAGGRPSLPATMLLNATAVVPVLAVHSAALGAGVVSTLVTAAIRATLVVWLLYALLPVPQEEVATNSPAGATPTTGTPMTTDSGVGRILAKVAIVLPVEFFYLRNL
jgi:hypothetical protein